MLKEEDGKGLRRKMGKAKGGRWERLKEEDGKG